MADLNANINVGIETTQALNQLKSLQRQISQFHQSVAKSSAQAAIAQRDLQRNFLNGVNAIQGFSAELKTVRTTAESFTNSLEKNKFSMREYFRYSAGATKTFGKNFVAEMSTIEKTAIERVKTLQTQYIKMGRDASGAMQAIAIRPTVLNMKDLGTQTAIAAQKQVIFNQLVKQGSTNLLNFGKNTQWAGRQLMVGFTLPLATLGMTAGRVFFDMEKAAIKFKKVYGDLFTAPAETQKAMESIVELGKAYSAYGVAVSESLSVAADAAAAGFAGVDLQNQTAAALKLSVLGQLELQKALETTISLQNAFQLSSADLAGEIDFLNAVENQTVVALDDMTEAIPRVAPVIQQLGGDVRDLAFFLAAMKEGGINAAQGANALKSGLASLINPTERAAQMLSGLGVNIRSIVSENQGDIAGTVYDFAKALDNLDPLNRAQAIEQLFGKFQFARISALFDNITREGTQAQRVLELAGSSAEELAALSESELATSAASSMNKFRSAVEKLKVALAPIGELFVEIATPFVEFGTRMLEAFNNLPGGIKTVVGTVITILGGIGPVALMTFGLINNGIANMIKFFATVRLGYLKITGQAKGVGDETQYMTQEQLEAAAAAASLDQAHAGLTQRFTAEKSAVDALTIAYQKAAAAGAAFALNYPGMMKPGMANQTQRFANGGIVTGPGTGTSDSIPALLSNGEAVIPAKQAKQYAPLIEGMIAGNLPGFAKGVMLGMPKSGKATAKNREAADAIYQQFLKSSYANTPPTEYGHQISPTSGHSFPIFGLGGVYQKGDKRVFVKPVMDETAALAEIRGTQITRQAHGLEAPEQRIVVIRDPMDTTRQRRFLALESDLDAKFIQNEPKALFNDEQYFRQLVASLVRVDKDLAAGNVFGNVVADVGPAGVFDRASGIRALKTDLPSMEEQAMINLLGIKGGAKRAFAESTLSLMAGLTPQQYHQRMIGEIQRVLPALKKTVADFGLSNPTEAKAYDAMIKRLEAGLGVDWSRFHAIHSKVVPAVPKKPKIAGYAKGIVSVPGPKGKGDVVPAMLSPGEAVIPAEFAKKYAPLIQGIIAGNIPGYQFGTASVGGRGSVTVSGKPYETRAGSEEGIARIVNDLIRFGSNVEDVTAMLDSLEKSGKLTITSLEEAAKVNNKIVSENPNKQERLVQAHLQTTKRIDPITGERTMGSFTRRMLETQNSKLKKGQDPETFSKQYKSVTGGLNEAVLLGGVELTDSVKKTAQLIDDQIHDAALKIADGGKVTDQILEQAANEVLDTAEKAGGEMAQVARALKKVRDDLNFEVVAPATVETRRAAGIQGQNETELAMVKRLISEGKLYQEGRNVKTTELGRSLSSTAEFSRFDREGGFATKQRVNAVPGSKTYLDGLGSDPSKLAKVGVSLSNDIRDEVGESLLKASASASPSEKTIQASENMVDGVTETLVNSKDDVAKATETMVSPVTQKRTGPRRFSTDPAVMAALAGNQAVLQESRKPRRVIREGDKEAREAAQATVILSDANTDASKSARTLTDKLSSVSIGISAVTGILSMFGGEFAAVTTAISLITGGFYALSSITSALQGTFIATAAAARATSVANAMGAVSIGELFVKGRGVAGLFANLGTALKFGLRFLGPIGIGLSALAIAVPFLIKAFEDNTNRINGLGAAANLTEEKLKFLAEKFGVTARSINFAERVASAQATAGKSTGEKEQVVDLMIDPEFEKEFTAEIAGIKNATKEQADLALQSLATQLRNSGFETQAVDAIIAALVAKTGRTDLDLKFKSILIDDAKTAKAATDLAAKAVASFNKNVTEIRREGEAEFFNPMSITGYINQFNRSNEIIKETKAAAAVAKTSLDSLTLAFESGNISADIYSQSLSSLFNNLESVELLDSLAENLGLKDLISGLAEASDKALVLQAAIAGVPTAEDVEILEDKNATDDDKARARNRLAQATRRVAEAQAKQNAQTAVTNALAGDDSEAEAIEAKIAAYHDLVNSGIDAALAYEIVGDAARLAAIEQARLTDATNGNTAAFDALMAGYRRTDAAKKEFESLSPRGGGSNPIQEAIRSLKEQRQEILNTSAAYSQLRRSGMSAADSLKFAQNPELMSAMNAGLKVGSARWNEIIRLIKEAEAATKAWQNSTVQGRTEQFEDVYNRVIDLFEAEEAVLEAAFESATRSDNRLIDSLQEQIDVLNRRVEDYSRDLDGIAEQEEAINKAYDEKVEALEKTKKLNEDILRQQKSQLSLADALSQGDIGAAASALQESRAANAAAALGAQGNMLQLSREAELAGVRSPEGLTRVQIEERVKQLKKEISDIEFGALRDAKDRVAAAEAELKAKKEALTVAGTTRTELEAQKTAIDLAKARAEVYDDELRSALANVEGIVSGWKSLDTTITTNHVVNTITSGTGPIGPATPAATPATTTNPRIFVPTRSGMVGPKGMPFMAKGGMVKPAYFSAGGFARGTDTVPAMLTPGEFVINRNATKKFGPLLSAINDGGRTFTTPVYPEISRAYPSANIGGGLYTNNNVAEIGAPIDNSVYNYSLSVNVAGTNATPDQIANVVMRKLQNVESQRVRGQVVR